MSYTDMDIEEAINDFSNRFIDEISLSKTTLSNSLDLKKL